MRWFLILPFLIASCTSKLTGTDPNTIVSMQLIDRNGFSETISSKDRLANYQHVDFATPQPYKKVLRVFGRTPEGKSSSKITSYHENGQVSQYLEVVDGRAHGIYRQWHSNGKLKIEAQIVEGLPDIHEVAQGSWVFNGKSQAWDEQGNLIAEIAYDMGSLETPSFYYHPNGQLAKIIPFHRNEIDGCVLVYDEKGELLETTLYREGNKHGLSEGLLFQEEYIEGRLQTGVYRDPSGKVISEIINGKGRQPFFQEGALYSLTEFSEGVPQGLVEIFTPDQQLIQTYSIKEGMKTGEECEYYPLKATQGNLQPKLSLYWHEDGLQGIAKTWYENGVLESQREIDKNKKHGLSFAWYRDGQMMLMEEYDHDVLIKGTYFKKGDSLPFSRVDQGEGIASLYTPEGFFLKKIYYEKGKPLIDPPKN